MGGPGRYRRRNYQLPGASQAGRQVCGALTSGETLGWAGHPRLPLLPVVREQARLLIAFINLLIISSVFALFSPLLVFF